MKLINVEREKQLIEARLIAQASSALFPFLERRKEQVINKILGLYRDGKNTQDAVGELAAIESMRQEFKSKLLILEEK